MIDKILDVDINFEMPGIFFVQIRGEDRPRTLECKRVVVDGHAHPIWLDTIDGTRFNFQNVISIAKGV